MKTIIIKKIINNSIEESVAEILNEISDNDFQVSNKLVNDYKEIIEYDNEEETSLYWHIVDINYNKDGSIYSVNIDC